ncbi:extensin-like [Lathyrus oleraceus]|uniref:extensin-like n=1 Tax=Pisum sativum TaxID=3888 RepID=UPI0021D1B120|nr:extensin-like [Pisum sativum]
MEDVTVDTRRPLNARNLKSMGVIEKIRVKPSLDTSWEALKYHRKIPNSLYLFSKIDPPEVVAHYLQDLASQGVDISYFSMDWLPEHPPNFMKRQREPSKKYKKANKENLGEPSISRPLVPLIESPSKSLPPHSRSVNLKQIASSLPQTTPIYTQSEPPPSTTKPSDTPISNPPSPSFQKFNISTITLLVSEVEMLNEPISAISSTPSSPPYYILSSDSEPFDPQSPILAQLQAHALATQQQPEPEANIRSPFEQQLTPPSERPSTPPSEQQPPTPPPAQPPTPPLEQPTTTPSETLVVPPSENIIIPTSEPPADTTHTPPASSSPTPEPEPTVPTLEEAISLFAESSVEKIISLSENSGISGNPSSAKIH